MVIMTFAPRSIAVPIATYANHFHASVIFSGLPWAKMNLKPTYTNIITAITAPIGMAILTTSVRTAVTLVALSGLQIAFEFDEQGVFPILLPVTTPFDPVVCA